MNDIFKYPRTRHLQGSRFQNGDHDMESVPWSELAGKNLIVEEKIDGGNCGISFSENGEMLLQSRGHYLHGGPREKQFNFLKQWTAAHKETIFEAIGTRYVVYAENMLAKHTMFYDALPHYVLEFDVLDKLTSEFLDTSSRKLLLKNCPFESVLVISEGKVNSLSSLTKMITRSNFITPERWTVSFVEACKNAGVDRNEALKHTDQSDDMEGLYIKWEESGVVKGRYKYVRNSFTSAIAGQEQHWHDRPIIQNQLIPGAFEKAFE